MRSVTEDNKLLHELEFFFQDDLELYFNFKKNIDAAYTMKLTSDAERDFLNLNIENYLLYTPRPEFCDMFLKYCHLATTHHRPMLFIRRDGRLACIFCINSDRVITQRKHIYGLNEMSDIYHSFKNVLLQYAPTKKIAPPVLAVAKEAIAV